MAKLVSKTYGDALFSLALEENRTDEMLEEVTVMREILQQNEELRQLMNHPQIVKEEKIWLVEQIFGGRVSDEIVGLMRMVVDKGHFQEMDSIFSWFIDCVKEYKYIGTAYVTSATELREEQKQAIEKRLLETADYVEFEMHYAVDAALIGGLVIRIGDRVADSSIRTKLYNLTHELTTVQCV